MNVKLIGLLFRRFFENIVFLYNSIWTATIWKATVCKTMVWKTMIWKTTVWKATSWNATSWNATVEIPISEIGSKLASTSKRRGKGEKVRKKDERLVFADPKKRLWKVNFSLLLFLFLFWNCFGQLTSHSIPCRWIL
jgi:hypothetical protein